MYEMTYGRCGERQGRLVVAHLPADLSKVHAFRRRVAAMNAPCANGMDRRQGKLCQQDPFPAGVCRVQSHFPGLNRVQEKRWMIILGMNAEWLAFLAFLM